MLSLPVKSGWKPPPNSLIAIKFPLVLISPLSGKIIFCISDKSVDFPVPFGPAIKKEVPFSIWNETLFKIQSCSSTLFFFKQKSFVKKLFNS